MATQGSPTVYMDPDESTAMEYSLPIGLTPLESTA